MDGYIEVLASEFEEASESAHTHECRDCGRTIECDESSDVCDSGRGWTGGNDGCECSKVCGSCGEGYSSEDGWTEIQHRRGCPDGPIPIIRRADGTAFPFWVNVYELDRHYGGPEEGGWWFDAGTVLATVPCNSEDEAELIASKLDAQYPNTSPYGIGSVAYSGGVYDVVIETYQGFDYPEETPHYE